MRLVGFHVTNFRSVNDSGWIDVDRITALLGRNESGKSNLLLALHSLNPVGGIKPLLKIKDFPKDRKLAECTDETKVVDTRWSLTEEEEGELVELFPRAGGVKTVTVGRFYAAKHCVGFDKLPPLEYEAKAITGQLRKIAAAVQAAADKVEEGLRPPLLAASEAFAQAAAARKEALSWAEAANVAFPLLRKALATANAALSESQEELLDGVHSLAEKLAGDKAAHAKAREWVVKKIPRFVLMDEYPELKGHQHIGQYLDRKASNNPALGDKDFEKLCKVAGLSAEELRTLHQKNDAETRSHIANRASSVITREIRRLWKDRKLMVRFDLDAEHLHTFVSDPNDEFPVEVNFEERSRGFRWFFSFYITFAADTDGGHAADAILLLDEPGLYLHARSQEDFLVHMDGDFENQILYTTHSPFMVPVKALHTIRTVNITKEGTKVTNDPSGDSRTLFPLQTALGYDLAQSLFVGSHNLVVEGVTDYWFLSSVSEHLRDAGKTALDSSITITPAGGAQKVPYMVALLTAQRLQVLVLLDSEKGAEDTKAEILKAKLAKEKALVLISTAFVASAPAEADIEDLLDPATYEALVQESYAKELKGKKLTLNPNIPRIAKRVAAAFRDDLGMEFHKTRPAKLFLSKMGKDSASVLDAAAIERFARLFKELNERHAKLPAESKPFE